MNLLSNSGIKDTFYHLIRITFVFEGFPDSSVSKESTCNTGDPGSIPRLGRSAGEGEKLPIPLFWPEEFHGLYSPWGRRVGQD